MYVGMCTVTLRLAENHSLKGKRKVARSLLARLRSNFNVAAAEIEDQDAWHWLGIGVACVSSNGALLEQVLQDVIDFIESETRGDAELTDHRWDVIQGF